MSNETIITAEPGSPLMRVERIFDAPREKVFSAFVEKEKLEKWWSPKRRCRAEIDAREGGSWKLSDVSESGEDATFYGIFHELCAPERIVQTEEFEGTPERGHVILNKYEFTALDGGRTKLTLSSAFFNVETRDMVIQSGMEGGVIQHHRNLDALLKDMA